MEDAVFERAVGGNINAISGKKNKALYSSNNDNMYFEAYTYQS